MIRRVDVSEGNVKGQTSGIDAQLRTEVRRHSKSNCFRSDKV